MRVALLEFVSATVAPGSRPGDGPHAGPVALLREGRAMRDAILADFLALPDTEVLLIHHPEEPPQRRPRLRSIPAGRDAAAALRRAARQADAALVIAPETAGVLERLSRIVEMEGCLLLGPSPAAVRLAADKIATARMLAAASLPTPDTRLVRFQAARAALARRSPPYVLKPRDGAGCAGVVVVRHPDDVGDALRRLRAATDRDDFVVQEYVAGTPASLSLLAGEAPSGFILPLALGRQRLRRGPAMEYTGGEVPLHHPGVESGIRTGLAAARALGRGAGSLRGFIGIDLVLRDRQAVVIEINPRLTTSYLGLRRILSHNLVDLIRRAATGRRLPAAVTPVGACRFSASGRDPRESRVQPWITFSAGTSAARI
jgi:predicted ATP-grasp superfamily ATP-dependent carboligase